MERDELEDAGFLGQTVPVSRGDIYRILDMLEETGAPKWGSREDVVRYYRDFHGLFRGQAVRRIVADWVKEPPQAAETRRDLDKR